MRWKVLEVGKCSTDPSILGYPKEVDCNSQQAQRKLLAKIDTSTGKTCPPDTNRGVMPVGDEMFCFGEP